MTARQAENNDTKHIAILLLAACGAATAFGEHRRHLNKSFMPLFLREGFLRRLLGLEDSPLHFMLFSYIITVHGVTEDSTRPGLISRGICLALALLGQMQCNFNFVPQLISLSETR
jgi:hypothetical protein